MSEMNQDKSYIIYIDIEIEKTIVFFNVKSQNEKEIHEYSHLVSLLSYC